MGGDEKKNRTGRYIQQATGYKAFVPEPLPPRPPLELDNELLSLLSEADRRLGQLNGLVSIINDPNLFVYLYVRKEALLSSQIEGTQCSLEDILTPEKESADKGRDISDIEEVSNYVKAMNRGLETLEKLPVSNRLIKEIHRILMAGVRGSNKIPGEFRTSQNWIGPPGSTLGTAAFVPPPPQELDRCMGELEKYIHSDETTPPLIRAALIHAQFETVHPFLDGNGRLGRLLITFVLCHWGVIEKPLLYLSYFFKANRTEYYSRLMAVRIKGEWEEWIKFFLRGVTDTARMANAAALEIQKLHSNHLRIIHEAKGTSLLGQVFRQFCLYPIQTMPDLKRGLDKSTVPAIQRALDRLMALGILKEVTGKQRNRRYAYSEYLTILTRDTDTNVG